VLEALERKEQQVQSALSKMGCCGSSYSELYGVRLLRRATADPAVAVALLNTPLLERRQYVKAAMQKLGLLLPKYDSSAPSTSLGSAKERLHSVLDDLAMRILLTTLMDPPAMRCSNMLVNLETMETETYPEGMLLRGWQGCDVPLAVLSSHNTRPYGAGVVVLLHHWHSAPPLSAVANCQSLACFLQAAAVACRTAAHVALPGNALLLLLLVLMRLLLVVLLLLLLHLLLLLLLLQQTTGHRLQSVAEQHSLKTRRQR
jgi:hypothetical protein